MKILSLALFLGFLMNIGCSSLGKQWKSLISDGSSKEETQRAKSAAPTTYSQQNNMMPTSYRKYKRTTRKDIEDQSHLEGRSGSLWVMEGQGAYLFSQNIVRMIGDPLSVKIEGDPSEQLSTKSKVISKLLAQIEDRRRRAMGRGPAGEEKKVDNTKNAQGAGATQPQAALSAPPAPEQKIAEEKNDFNVKMVPTRVVERMVDGNYRVRGTQPFMIGTREYKVIVSGIVRAEDFNEDGISATQLLDSNYDIVSSKGSELRQ